MYAGVWYSDCHLLPLKDSVSLIWCRVVVTLVTHINRQVSSVAANTQDLPEHGSVIANKD